MERDIRTMSVRQLATLFDRSEQTIRRWKDKGINGIRLQALCREEECMSGDEEGRGGALAFTVEAVRAFTDINPNLLDKAAPELELILYGKKRSAFLRRKTGRMAIDEGDPERYEEEMCEEFGDLPAQTETRSRAIPVDDGEYMLHLLQRREKEILDEIQRLNQELAHIEKERMQIIKR